VAILEGVVAYMNGDPLLALKQAPSFESDDAAAGRVEYPRESEKYRFCTEALVRGDALPESGTVQAVLRERGDSLIVIRGHNVLKIHVHTDLPDEIFDYLRTLGQLVTHKAEDMEAQHSAVERAAAAHIQLARRPISIVTDSACDLPDEIVRAHGIHVVPMTLVYGEQALRDRIDIDVETFVQRLRAGEHSTTSQPPPAAFMEYYGRAAEDGENVVAITVGSSLSGTFASAEAAAKRFDAAPITVIDSLGASLLQGLLVLKAAELSETGNTPAQIHAELKRIRAQSGICFTVDVFDNLLKSGRVGRGRAMLGRWLDIKPVLEINQDGFVQPVTRVRGMKNVLPKMLEYIGSRLPAEPKKLRFGVIHVGCAEILPEISAAIQKQHGERDIIISPATPVIANHLGPGAWGLGWQLED
jgi:uncharacterized protein